MDNNNLQLGFSKLYGASVFDRESRKQKAQKALAILEDRLGDISRLDALDIGCSAGNSTIWYAQRFRHVVGADIDAAAVGHAYRHNRAPNIDYYVMDAQRLSFADNSFDVVICTHIYEHVPDASKLLREIGRVLKPRGVCYFTAANRLSLIEPHYRLPLLSVVPKRVSHAYLRLLNRGKFYYENHLTYWGLRRLVAGFDLDDYTMRVVKDPERFRAMDVIAPGSLKQKFSLLLLKTAYWLCPTYLWLLIKTRPPTA